MEQRMLSRGIMSCGETWTKPRSFALTSTCTLIPVVATTPEGLSVCVWWWTAKPRQGREVNDCLLLFPCGNVVIVEGGHQDSRATQNQVTGKICCCCARHQHDTIRSRNGPWTCEKDTRTSSSKGTIQAQAIR